MDMRLGIEPLHVIERRHIEKAVAACNGKVPYAAELLAIGRATIYRKMSDWRSGTISEQREGLLERREGLLKRREDRLKQREELLKQREKLLKRREERDWSRVKPDPDGPLERRRRCEEQIELHGGNLSEAAGAMGVRLTRLQYSMGVWHRDNEVLIRSKAKIEGISEDEIEVMLRRRSMEEHAQRCGFCENTGYKMIDEACALVGLRRYRHWLFLRA